MCASEASTGAQQPAAARFDMNVVDDEAGLVMFAKVAEMSHNFTYIREFAVKMHNNRTKSHNIYWYIRKFHRIMGRNLLLK